MAGVDTRPKAPAGAISWPSRTGSLAALTEKLTGFIASRAAAIAVAGHHSLNPCHASSRCASRRIANTDRLRVPPASVGNR
jgi:hypothetical protein